MCRSSNGAKSVTQKRTEKSGMVDLMFIAITTFRIWFIFQDLSKRLSIYLTASGD